MYPFFTLVETPGSADVLGSEHCEVMLIPSADNIETGSPPRYMIQGRQGAGRPNRMNDWNLHGRKERYALSERAERRRLRHRFHAPATRVCSPTVPAPT